MPPTIPTPGQLATQAQTKFHTLVTLTRAGIVHPERPGPPVAHGARGAALRHDAGRGLHGGGAQLPGRAGDHPLARHALLQGRSTSAPTRSPRR